MDKIRVAIVGVGNCASSLVQGIHFYDSVADGPEGTVGLAHPTLGGWRPGDIEIVAAIDVDARKVGRPLHEAIGAPPNNTKVFFDDFTCDVEVAMGNVLDGVAEHLAHYPEAQRFVVADRPSASAADIEKLLRNTGAEILMNYLPVGSQRATEFYAECCLRTGVSLINCIPVFIVSDAGWGERFRSAGIPCVGDDVKAQVGATITHRVLARMMHERGAAIDATYQLNTGGNTDFLNMLNHKRLDSKRISKTEAVQSQLLRALAEGQQGLLPADRGAGLRRRAAQHRAAPQRGGLAQLRRRDGGRHPLLQAGARRRPGRAARCRQRLHHEAPPAAAHRRRRPRHHGGLHRHLPGRRRPRAGPARRRRAIRADALPRPRGAQVTRLGKGAAG